MKKVILGLIIFISSISYSQLKNQGKAEKAEIEIIGKLDFGFGAKFAEMSKKQNVYTLAYKDLQYSQLDVWEYIVFEDKDNAFENLYSFITNQFEKKDDFKQEIKLILGASECIFNFKKTLGFKCVYINCLNFSGSYATSRGFGKSDIEKIFGKNIIK
ncbi:hypothetical protein JE943_000966 [Flavobacterium psychrophilum]|nr:hypothetical protein [Flavobacterium psychrophilum]